MNLQIDFKLLGGTRARLLDRPLTALEFRAQMQELGANAVYVAWVVDYVDGGPASPRDLRGDSIPHVGGVVVLEVARRVNDLSIEQSLYGQGSSKPSCGHPRGNMAEQQRPTSSIPRISRLPVRSSLASLSQPNQSHSGQNVAGGQIASLKVSKLRPSSINKGSSSTGQPGSPTARFVAPLQKDPFPKGGPAGKTTTSKHDSDETFDRQLHEQTTDFGIAQPKIRKPSLADRAVESLSQIPPSPSPRRRQSGFFPPNSPAIRPPSSLGRSRPATSTAFYPPLPTSRPASPTKRLGPARPSQPPLPSRAAKATPNTGQTLQKPTLKSGHRIAAPSVQPSPDLHAASNNSKTSAPGIPNAKAHLKRDRNDTLSASTVASPKSTLKSSAALRDTIANARAARRAAPAYEADEVVKPIKRHLNLPGPEPEPEDDTHVNPLRRRINAARGDGRLNISGMGLKTFPDKVLKMYDSKTMTDGPAWYESVDLVRLDVSNNEIEDLGWDFTDVPTGQDDDQPCENIFLGLQTLDLHGNRLRSLPASLPDFEQLTFLNLSKNDLGQSVPDIIVNISRITSLRELHLAENGFSGPLPPFSGCSQLEILDLHGNTFTSLPDELSNCSKLRRIDVSANRISSIPSLSLPHLASLNVSRNQLDIDTLTTNLAAPKLAVLDISMCRIGMLPNLLRSKFPDLTTLTAHDNSISAIDDVEAFRGLEVLDLKNNDLRSLPAELCLLGLKKLTVGGNPMRAPRREILEGTTERLMEWLRGRLPTGTLDEETF
ncbi:MAG: hypothetical protein LQ344_000791 [Seirophora lacunosa]|nr:MAG: hypothetical protein LQ344_000791 [Seirophora lacunosa]